MNVTVIVQDRWDERVGKRETIVEVFDGNEELRSYDLWSQLPYQSAELSRVIGVSDMRMVRAGAPGDPAAWSRVEYTAVEA